MAKIQKKKNQVFKDKDKKQKINANKTKENLPEIIVENANSFVVKKSKFSSSSIKGNNVFTNSIKYLREVGLELKKVVWPPKKQIIASTAVTIVLTIIVAIFLGLNDFVLSNLIKLVLK